MKRSVVLAVGAAVAVIGTGAGWFFYQRHQKDELKLGCFNGTNADACVKLAVVAFKEGQLSDVETLVRQHCYQLNGISEGVSPNVLGAGLCVVKVRRQVEALAAVQ